jgi:hypothetical protein
MINPRLRSGHQTRIPSPRLGPHRWRFLSIHLLRSPSLDDPNGRWKSFSADLEQPGRTKALSNMFQAECDATPIVTVLSESSVNAFFFQCGPAFHPLDPAKA